MNPDPPLTPSQEQEARLTALLLGELSAEETAALRQRLQEDPQLARLYASLETTLGLVREAVGSADDTHLADPSLKLSPARRENLVASFKIARPATPARFSFVAASEVSRLAAMLFVLLALAGLLAYPLLEDNIGFLAKRPMSLTPVPGKRADYGSRNGSIPESLSRIEAGQAMAPASAVELPASEPPAPQPVPAPIVTLGVTMAGRAVSESKSRVEAPYQTSTEGDAKLDRAYRKAPAPVAQTVGTPPVTASPVPAEETTVATTEYSTPSQAVPQDKLRPVLLGADLSATDNKQRADGDSLVESLDAADNRQQTDGRWAGTAALSKGAGTRTLSSEAARAVTAPKSARTATASDKEAEQQSSTGKGTPHFGLGGAGGAVPTAPAPTAATDFFAASGPALARQRSERGSTLEGLAQPAAPARDQHPPAANFDVASVVPESGAEGLQTGTKRETPLRLGEVQASTGLPALQDQEPLAQPESRFDNSTRFNRSAGVATVTNQSSSLWFFSKEKHEPSQDAAKAKAAKTLAIVLPSSRLREEAQDSEERKIEDTFSALVAGKPSDAKPALEEREKVAAFERLLETRVVRPPAGAPEPQPEKSTSGEPFSTFSLNVSDVSFKLAAAALEKGVMPEPATVRSEEFINAFDYRDPEPAPGVPLAFAWEQARHPFAHNRDLLRFSLKTAASGRPPGRPLNIVLLLDNSGSMERADRVRILRECLRVLAGQLQPQDRVSVVAFARTARLWVDGLPGSHATELGPRVGGLTPEGGTNLEEALKLAYQTALRHYTAQGLNRVVLLTDGAANLGDTEPQSLQRQVEAHRRQGIALDCFGIGWEGYNDDLLEQLARHGDGRYGFVNTPAAASTEFAGQLAGAFQVAASDVKVQVEFNPRRVTAYRQIGYAKHQLTKEQFRDNTVDAAEIGAAETGTALYAVAVDPRGEGPLATVRVRYKVPGTGEYHEHAWPVPFTGGALALEHSSPALRLAAVAASFSEWLVSSPYAGEVTADRLLGYLRGVPEVYGADARPKRLEGMIRLAKSVAGRQE